MSLLEVRVFWGRTCVRPWSAGDSVVCVDDLSTGNLANIAELLGNRRFRFVRADVSAGLEVHGYVDAVAHLASPASPPDYLRRPLETLAVGSRGQPWAAVAPRTRCAWRRVPAPASC